MFGKNIGLLKKEIIRIKTFLNLLFYILKIREKSELVKILRDKQLDISTLLQKEGYKIRIPRAEWSVFISSVIIYNEDGSSEEIPDYRLINILEGKENLTQDKLKLLNEWYQISAYRFGYEIDKLKKQIKLAKKNGDRSNVGELENKLNAILYEKDSLNAEELRKKQFAYYYNEEGGRLERLYEILIGKYEHLRFGAVRVSMSSNSYLDEILEECYGVSKGFFEDLCITYDFIQKITGPIKFSPSSGLTYTDEDVSGEGKGLLSLDGKPIALKAKIEKALCNLPSL